MLLTKITVHAHKQNNSPLSNLGLVWNLYLRTEEFKLEESAPDAQVLWKAVRFSSAEFSTTCGYSLQQLHFLKLPAFIKISWLYTPYTWRLAKGSAVCGLSELLGLERVYAVSDSLPLYIDYLFYTVTT